MKQLLTSAAALILGATIAPRPWSPMAPPDPQLNDLLNRAAKYVEDYEDRFELFVATEDYLQEVSGPGGRESRRLQSELVVTHLPNSDRVALRDVYKVDGRAVRDRDARLVALLSKPTNDAQERAKLIMDESARFNIGPVRRTINVPTLALMFLRRENLQRSSFQLKGFSTEASTRLAQVIFEEVGRPRLIESSQDLAAHGRFWFETDTGRVTKTELTFRSSEEDSARVTVTYRMNPNFGECLPILMEEEYRLESSRPLGPTTGSAARPALSMLVKGRATYSDYRKFRTSATVIIR